MIGRFFFTLWHAVGSGGLAGALAKHVGFTEMGQQIVAITFAIGSVYYIAALTTKEPST